MKKNTFRKIWEKIKYSRKIKYTEILSPSEIQESASFSIYREFAELKKIVADDVKKWNKAKPYEKQHSVLIKKGKFSTEAFNYLFNHLRGIGWDVKVKNYVKSELNRGMLLRGFSEPYSYTEYIKVEISFPEEQVENTNKVKLDELLKGENTNG